MFSATNGKRARKVLHVICVLELIGNSWTKLVGKSGPWFNSMVGRLRDIGLPERATKYAKLEKVLIDYKVRALLGDVRDIEVNNHHFLYIAS